MSKELPIIISKGLASVTSKDNPDFETWRKAHEEELYHYSFDDAKRIYKNGLFVNKYGKEKFESLSPEDRDNLYEFDAINTYLQDNYSEDERFEEINNLTLEGKRELINSGYLNPLEITNKLNKIQEESENAIIKPKNDGFLSWLSTAIMNAPEAGMVVSPAQISNEAARKMPEISEDVLSKNQEYTLNNIIENDKERKAESINEDYYNIMSSYTQAVNNGDISQEDLNTEIEKAFRGYTTTINTPDGSAEYEIPGSRYYNVFKDSKWLEDLSEKEKLEYFSKYQAIANKYGLADAIYYLDSELQKRIADKQNWFTATYKTAWQTTVTGVVPDMIKTFISAPALFMDEKKAANYLQEYAKYFDDVSKYGTWKTDLINEAEANGGISQRKIVWNKDQENSWVSGKTFVDVAEQSKWMMELGLSAYFGTGLFNVLNKTLNTSNKVLNAIVKGTSYLAKTGIEVSPIATTEAYQVFDDTRKANYDSINTKIEDVALQNAIDQIKEVEAQRSIDEMTNRAILEFRKSNPNIKSEDIDIEAFRKKAEQEYLYFLKEKNKEAISPLYDKERELADITSVDAFQTTYLLSAVKTAGINRVARGFLETLPINKAIKSPSSKVKTKTNSSGLVEEIPMSTYSKYIDPILSHTLWEGVDEMADEFISAFGRGYGTTKFEQFVDPNPDYNALDRYMASILGGMVSTGNALFEEETWKAGFLGAISGPATVNLNLRHKLDPINGEYYTFLEKVNNWVTNPILNDVIENKYVEARTKERIENVNKILQKHSDTYKGIADVVKILDSQNSSIMFGNAEDALSYNHDLQVAFMLELDALSKDSMTSSSEILENTRKIIDNAAKGNISEEDINSFIANNRGTSVTKEEAKQRIQENATKLLDIQKKIEDKRKSLKGNYHFDNLNERQQDQLISDILLVENRKERIESIKSKLGLTSNDKTSIIAGSSKHADVLFAQLKEEFEFIRREIDRLEFAEDYDSKEYDPKTRKAKRVMLKELNKSRVDLYDKSKKLKEQQFDENGFSKTLSAEEIKRLDSESLERMLNPDNSRYYSEEQQAEIEKVREELDKTIASSDLVNGESYTYAETLSKLEREASIVDRINNAYLTYGLDGHSLASLYKRREKKKEIIKSNNNKKARLSSINEFVYDIEGNQTTDLEKVALEASKYSEEDINDFIEENKESLSEDIIEELNKGKVKRQLKNTIGSSVNSINTTNDIKEIALNAVNTIIDNNDVDSVDDISSHVKSIIEDPNIDKELKDAITQILNNLEGVSKNEKTKEVIEAPIIPSNSTGNYIPTPIVEPRVDITQEEEKMIESEVPKVKPEDIHRGDTNPNAESELITFALNLASKGINGYTKETRDRVVGIINNASPYCTKEELSEYLLAEANRLDSQSSDENDSYASSLLRQCASKVANRKDSTESPQEGGRREALNVFERNKSRASNIESLNMDQVARVYPDSPNAKFYEKYKVREFLESNQISNRTPVVFISDPSFVEEVEESMRSNGANPTVYSLPLVAAVEVESGGIEIDGKHYQPIALMPSTDSQTKRGAARLGDVRTRAYKQKDSGKVELVKDEDGDIITTTIYGNINAEPPTQIKPELPNKSAYTLLINDASESDRRELQNLSKADRRSPIYQKLKSAFLSRLSHRKVEKGEELVYNVPNLKGNEEIPIIALVTSSHKTVDRNSDELIIDLVKRGDKSALKSNSRIIRYTKALNKFFSETFNTSEFSFEQDDKGNVVPSESTKKALDNYATQLDNILGNFLNLPSRSGWKYKIESTGRVVDGKIEYNLSIQDSYDNIINLATLTEGKISEDTQLEVIRNLMVDSNTGEARMRDSKYGFVVWNVVFNDAGNDSEGAKNNMADIFDDDIIEFSKESLKYTIKGVTLNAPFSGLGEPLYKKGNQGTSVDGTNNTNTENGVGSGVVGTPIENTGVSDVVDGVSDANIPFVETIDPDTGAVIGSNVQTESVQEQTAEVESKPVEAHIPGKVRNRFENSLDSKTTTKTVSPKYQWGVFEGAKMSVDEITDALIDQDIYTEEDWDSLSEPEKDRILKCCGAL